MSKNTVLRLIAPLIFAILAGIHQGLGWFLDQMSPQFAYRALSDALVVMLMCAIAAITGAVAAVGCQTPR